jgi:autotransporter-associated beta strand protein
MIISNRLSQPCRALAGAGVFASALVAAPADAAGLFWSGRESADWSNPANWNSHIPPPPDGTPRRLNFDRHSAAPSAFGPNLDADLTAASLRFHGGDFTLGSSANKKLSLLLNSTVDADAAIVNIVGGNTINHDVAFTGGVNNARAVYVDSGTLRFGAGATLDFSGMLKEGVSLALTRVHVAGGARLVSDGAVKAAGARGQYDNNGTPANTGVALLKTGGGVWTINSDNNDLSLLTNFRIQEGALEINAPRATGTAAIGCSGDGHRAICINTPGGTLAASFNFIAGGANSSLTIGTRLASGTVSFTGVMALSAAGTADADSRATRFAAPEGATVVVSGAIGDSHATNANRQGGIDKTGGGALILTGNNTYTQGTTVSSGTVFFNHAASSAGTGAVLVKEGAAIAGWSDANTGGRIAGAVVTGGTASTIIPGNGDPATATPLGATRLTIGGNLDVTAGARIHVNSSTSLQIMTTGTLLGAAASRVIVDFTGSAFAGGSLPADVLLVSFASALGIDASAFSAAGLPDGRTATFSIANGNRLRVSFADQQAVSPPSAERPISTHPVL